jgi:hypothetical protein
MNRRSTSAAVTVALVTLDLGLSGCTGSSNGEETSSHATAPASVSSDPGDATSSAPPHLSGQGAPLTPGTYQFSFVADPGVESPDALVDVPTGFVEGDDGYDWYVVSDDGDTFLGLWVIDEVDHDACLHADADAFDPGPSVEDLADALVAQKSTRAAPPEPVTIAGHPGQYVELASPRDLSGCEKYPGLWREPERPIYRNGQVDRVWIVDVDGQRLAVDASYGPGSTAVERDQLTSMVNSLEFVAAG